MQNTSRAKAAAQERDRVDMTFDGATLHGIVRDLFPLTRSITGDGLRETLARIDRFVPLEFHEVPTGTPALDWNSQEWNIRRPADRDARRPRRRGPRGFRTCISWATASQSTGRSRAMNSRPMSTPFRTSPR